MTKAFITGLSGTVLSPAERDFIQAEQPWGLILFRRNIETPEQVAALTAEVRNLLGEAVPILVDQEGGRVQRFRPPNWPLYPAGAAFGQLYGLNPALGLRAARLSARLIADDLARVGVTVDCLPLADVPIPDADDVIGDRAYGNDARTVAVIARAVTDGLEEGGIL